MSHFAKAIAVLIPLMSITCVDESRSRVPGAEPTATAAQAVDAITDDLQVGPGASFVVGRDSDDDGDRGRADRGREPVTFNLGLRARKDNRSILMGLGGPALSLCSARGPSMFVDFATEGGNNPLSGVQCGRGFGLGVEIDRCHARLEYHGMMHSDRSGQQYLGPISADVHFRKTGAQSGSLRVKIYAPRGPIVLSGEVSSPTPIHMPSCTH